MLEITAYADKISVDPGDTLAVKVSCDGLATYRAELRRIIQGDINPDGPGYRDALIALDLGGPFRGRHQPIPTGSCGVVPIGNRLSALRSFTVAALVWPTLPGQHEQSVISHGPPEQGFTLALDPIGAAAFTVASHSGVATATTGVACLARHWYLLVASFDGETGRLSVTQHPMRFWPGIADGGFGRDLRDGGEVWSAPEPLLFAARQGHDGRRTAHFNGKIEAPRIYQGVCDVDRILAELQPSAGVASIAVALWDFALDMEGDRIVDTGSGRFDGRVMHLPHRAVSGFFWDGSVHRWTDCPAHYAAIHFHDDDLYDAGWETDFDVTIPLGTKSGVYAVRLFSDEDPDAEFFVVFAVRPTSEGRADAVFVMPTASYMAYANHRLGLDVSETEVGAGQLLQLDRHHLHLQAHPEHGLSLYETHSDGSGVFYTSRLRPILDLQPKVQGFIGGFGSNIWQFNADTHILGWLERIGVPFDVLTDEDLDRDAALALAGYRVAITGSHPEYASTRMLDAYAGFLERGGRVMYLGGNGFYWRVGYHPRLPAVIECRRSETGIRGWEPGVGNYSHQFTGELGGLWRRIGRAPQQLFGVGMTAQGFDLSSPYVRTAASRDPRAAFIFAGVEGEVIGDFGLNGSGAAGNEIDRADFALGTPPHALVLASSREHTDLYLMTPEDLLDPTPIWTGTLSEMIRADMVFFETESGGAVFSTGSIAWAGAMAWREYDNAIARITGNVLRRFRDPLPFL